MSTVPGESMRGKHNNRDFSTIWIFGMSKEGGQGLNKEENHVYPVGAGYTYQRNITC